MDSAEKIKGSHDGRQALPATGFATFALVLLCAGAWLAQGVDPAPLGSVHLAGFAFLGLQNWFRRNEECGMSAPQTPDALPRAAWPPVQLRPVHDQPPGETQAAAEPVDEVDRLVAHIGAQVGGGKRILVTHAPAADAPLAHIDCAGFASRLARSLALQGRTILVTFGSACGDRPGLVELMTGDASFSEAIHRECGSRLHILPQGRGRVGPGASLNLVIDTLSETYDFVVLAAAEPESEPLRRLSVALAERADLALIGCAGQMNGPEMTSLRDALRGEGAGEVMAARIGLRPGDAREAA